jgi:uncharacterized protein
MLTRIHVLAPHGADGPDEARQRVEAEVARLRELGASATGEAVDAEPFEAVTRELAREGYDEVIVCTRPPGLSRWLHLDLVGRIERHTDIPVRHLLTQQQASARAAFRAVRLSIFVGESVQASHGTLYSEIVRRARRAGLAGASVLRGVEGFGASNVIHTTRLLSMSEDLPMVVVIVDAPDRIEAFMPELDELVTEGLVVRDEVDVIKYEAHREA